MKNKKSIWKTLTGLLILCGGCVSPQVTKTNQISPDADPFLSGISSSDVRTVASKLCPEVLSVPEIADAESISRITVADFKNNSRFMIDRNLFLKRLVLELNQQSRGKVRFINSNTNVNKRRTEVLKDRQSSQLESNLKNIAIEIASSPVFLRSTPVKIAMMPVLNTNFVNLNAESFMAMLRSELFNAAAGKIQFLMPGSVDGADYYLTGQFIPESMKTEGIINLTDYIEVIDHRVKNGKSMYIVSDPAGQSTSAKVTTVSVKNTDVTTITPAEQKIYAYENYLKKILDNPAMQKMPDVNKRLNIIVVDAKSKASVYEKMFLVDRKITDNSGRANFVLSGEINGMHQRKNGINADYLVISVQLTDIENNEVIFEGAYEVKRLTESGIVYR